MVSEHELFLNVAYTIQNFKAITTYSYSSPKYLNFTNTKQNLHDSSLNLTLKYSYQPIEISLNLNNILNAQRETYIQNPLPGFHASLDLSLSL